jgi:hypothetical protein
MLAPDLGRAPVHADSVAITEWYMDSHSCSTARVPGGMEEGKAMLHYETFPGQIPYRCLLPKGVDNLLVPLCLSATHVAWGTVRLEPVFIQTGESAGLAAALALKKSTTPGHLDPAELVRRLCELRSMVTFFNDVDVSAKEAWIPAALYFGTQGFVHDYNLRAAEPLKQSTGKIWIDGLKRLSSGNLDPMAQVRAVAQSEAANSESMTQGEFSALLPNSATPRTIKPSAVVTRGEALAWMFQALKK